VSGALVPRSPQGDALFEADRQRSEKQKCRAAAYQACADEQWQETVEALAHRGFTLGKLLDFYKQLPKVMPHFSPDIHTTNDVVRQAIIPQSADQKCAISVKMMGGKKLRPQKMVTHNWSNLFRDLVAAIVADALHESTFSLVAYLLDSDMAALERMLGSKALETSYWVCAFSVNQHQSICASNPTQAVDPKTGVEHSVCACGADVYFNTTPPLRSDGASILCQMNKFDDMMAFLSATDPEFAQVIAIDRGFGLFNRAWCVAELAAADNMGMRQHLKLASRGALRENESARHLRDLDVATMQASRPEDVKEILAKIPDVSAFNNHLQELLFGDQGLFDRCKHFDVLEQAAEVGRAALFADAMQKRATAVDGASPSDMPPDTVSITVADTGTAQQVADLDLTGRQSELCSGPTPRCWAHRADAQATARPSQMWWPL